MLINESNITKQFKESGMYNNAVSPVLAGIIIKGLTSPKNVNSKTGIKNNTDDEIIMISKKTDCIRCIITLIFG